MNKFFTSLTGILMAAAAMHIVWLTVARAYQDYGWLGALVFMSIGLPFSFVIVPLVAWWIWPGTQAQVLYAILIMASASAFLASKTKPQ